MERITWYMERITWYMERITWYMERMIHGAGVDLAPCISGLRLKDFGCRSHVPRANDITETLDLKPSTPSTLTLTHNPSPPSPTPVLYGAEFLKHSIRDKHLVLAPKCTLDLIPPLLYRLVSCL
jgi:hypothetical protein